MADPLKDAVESDVRSNKSIARDVHRNPYETLLPSSGHVAWWVCLHKHTDEQFINNDSVCKLERDIDTLQ